MSRISIRLKIYSCPSSALYTVLTVWNGDRLTDMTVKAIMWENGAAFRTESVTVNDGETMEFAIWDSFTCPKVLPKEIVMH